MKQYDIWFRRGESIDIREGFLSVSEAREELKAEGFRWSESQQKWEQTYANVDPYDELAVANVYTEATVVTNEIREDDGIVRQIA